MLLFRLLQRPRCDEVRAGIREVFGKNVADADGGGDMDCA